MYGVPRDLNILIEEKMGKKWKRIEGNCKKREQTGRNSKKKGRNRKKREETGRDQKTYKET